MRLSRFLVAGVLVPVVLGTNDSTAEVCSGRFYVGVNVGAEFGKMKYSSKPGDQYDVVPDGLPVKTNVDMPMLHSGEQVKDDDFRLLPKQPVNVKLPVFPKKKLCFVGDVEVGYIFEVNSSGIGIGLGLTFGKRFGVANDVVKSKLQIYNTRHYAGAKTIDWRKSVEDPALDQEFIEKWYGVQLINSGDYKKATKYNTKDVTEIKLKNKFNVTITPIIEYKANPMFGVYITGGIRISNDKVTYKETDGATKKVTNFKKTKTSIAPVVGGGVMINLSDHMYAKVQYLYQFGSKIKKTISRKINDKKNEVTPTVQYRSQKVTVGFGYMF